ncbi:hypothetical protein D3C71_1087990 [compost metagenome]
MAEFGIPPVDNQFPFRYWSNSFFPLKAIGQIFPFNNTASRKADKAGFHIGKHLNHIFT